MSAIRVRKKIDSDTLHLPELAPFIGRTVDIVIEDQPTAGTVPPGVVPGTGDWDAFRRAAEGLRDTYDYDANPEQDACDLRDAEDRLK